MPAASSIPYRQSLTSGGIPGKIAAEKVERGALSYRRSEERSTLAPKLPRQPSTIDTQGSTLSLGYRVLLRLTSLARRALVRMGRRDRQDRLRPLLLAAHRLLPPGSAACWVLSAECGMTTGDRRPATAPAPSLDVACSSPSTQHPARSTQHSTVD